MKVPDNYDERNKKVVKQEESASIGVNRRHLSGNLNSKTNDEIEVERSWEINKLNELKTSIDKVKLLIKKIVDLNSKNIFLILDDFYFLPKMIQPFLLDYFHRLSKSNNFYLKIGTIKHRSHLYFQSKASYIGMELNADIYDIDLDYTLDKWNDLKKFKRELLGQAVKASEADIEIDTIFAGKSFDQLCIASGGVPRDFLVLLIKCCQLVNKSKYTITART